MRFGVLGAVEVWDGESPVPVERPQQRALLAVLLMHPNQVVSADRLIAYLWGDRPPAGALALLQGCVFRLRRSLRPHLGPMEKHPIQTRPPGYRLSVRPGELDLDRFEDMAAAARRSATEGSPRSLGIAADLFRGALALWRGPALADVKLDGLTAEAVRLDERRLSVLEERIETDLRLGLGAGLVAELRALVTAHPVRERLWAQLMLALYADDRQAEALAVYGELRRTLVDELGVEPGPAVRQVQHAILTGDGALARGRATWDVPAQAGSSRSGPPPSGSSAVGPARTADAIVVPAQLPPAVAGFAGRDGPLTTIDHVRAESADDPTLPAPIVVISGPPGVGKTTLAVHWAHRAAGGFADGHMYVDLRGYDANGPAMNPAAAVRDLLEALGVPPQQLPAGLSAQVGLYRSLMAGRRMLVLLDNARDPEQVQPLLPASTGCFVVVTSRDRLTGLVATYGAHPLILDPLTSVEAHSLLARRLGAARVAAEPTAVAEIVARCSGLPLALVIVAARAANHLDFPLEALAAELRAADGSLTAFDGAGPAVGVRAVISWSCRTLSAGAARLFRLLGVHAGPDISAPAAASLAGASDELTRPLLDELTRVHQLLEHRPGRYTMHDLVRAYATERARAEETDAEVREALRRVFDHYMQSAHGAALLLHPHRDAIPIASPRSGAAATALADRPAALAWFTAEHAVLLTAVQQAAGTGFDAHAWQLAWCLMDYLDYQGHWHDQEVVQRTALAAALRQADPAGQAHALRGLARTHARQGSLDDALVHFERALDLYRRSGDHIGAARTHLSIGLVFEQQGRVRAALPHDHQAVEMFRVAGHRAGQANAANNLGWHHALLDEHQEALLHCDQALTTFQEIGDPYGEGSAWDSLGYSHHRLGHHQRATACYRTAIDLMRQMGDHHHEAVALIHLGDTEEAAGDLTAARSVWRQALSILDGLGHSDAQAVRAKLIGSSPD
jgi:DNA-binding SARP family transcriptional activator/tetratricopeptide (TPR) repeat protein